MRWPFVPSFASIDVVACHLRRATLCLRFGHHRLAVHFLEKARDHAITLGQKERAAHILRAVTQLRTIASEAPLAPLALPHDPEPKRPALRDYAPKQRADIGKRWTFLPPNDL